MPDQARDFVGYADRPPDITWPNGARIAINFVLNYEEGAEYTIADGDGRSEAALTEVNQPRVPTGMRDLASETMYEYGSRVGFWRLYHLFRDRNLPLTVFAAALAIERNPEAARAIAETNWDITAHGFRWVEHYHMDEATERAEIALAFTSLSSRLGRAPQGWYCRYGPSPNTRRLVVEHGGYAFDCDSYADELPFWVPVAGRSHLVVPYSLVTNDAKFHAGGLVTGRDYATFLEDSLTVLRAEASRGPRMMSVGLHPRIVGHPGRCAGLISFLDHVSALNDVWVCRRADLAAHWRDVVPPPPHGPVGD
ncbi:MAG: polysaccharide deacetylase family protein [Pseudomonadota bacterium]